MKRRKADETGPEMARDIGNEMAGVKLQAKDGDNPLTKPLAQNEYHHSKTINSFMPTQALPTRRFTTK